VSADSGGRISDGLRPREIVDATECCEIWLELRRCA